MGRGPQGGDVARVWIAVDGKKKVWKLPETPVYIGSGENVQIRLDDPGVAGRHCRIEKTAEGWKVSLLAEDSPILVNGNPVAEHYLAQGDVIKVGGTEIHFELMDAPASAPAAKSGASRSGSSSSRRSSPAGRSRAGASGGRSSSRGRRRSSRAVEEQEERPARGRYSRKSQGLPSWVTLLLGVVGAAVVILVAIKAVQSTNPSAKLVEDSVLQFLADGDFDKANEKLDAARGILSEEKIAELRNRIEEQRKKDQERQKRAMMENEFRVYIKRFEESKVVRVQKKPHRVFDLMIRCELYLKDHPDSPHADEVRRIMEKYRGVVDMDNPDFKWIVSMIRYPYEKSRQHKRFDRSLRLLQLVKARYPQFNNPEQMGRLEAETLRFANMYGRKEVEEFVYKKIIQAGETSIPVINQEIKDLDWMIKHVGLPEWQEKGKRAMKDLLEYRDKVARKLSGG